MGAIGVCECECAYVQCERDFTFLCNLIRLRVQCESGQVHLASCALCMIEVNRKSEEDE